MSRVPKNACDSHLHIYDHGATAAQYRRVRERLGTQRAVVVQAAVYGTDNRVTVAAIEALGRDRTRGIAVVHPQVADHELEALAAAGVVGLRFTQHDPATAVTTPGMIEPLAHRIAALGWHTQLHLRAAQIVAMAALIERLPGTIVFDHMGRMPAPEGCAHPAFAIVRRLLESGRAWVKLSGPYLEARSGAPGYAHALAVARELVRIAPERCVWGSDWPHPTEGDTRPDDAALLDLLPEWAGGEAARAKILVDNPARLYGFE